MADPLVALSESMHVDQFRLRSISQNLANVNTPAYKRSVPQVSSFDALLGEPAVGAEGEALNIRRAATTDFTQGAIKMTGNPNDIAIGSDAFLVVSKEGQQFYTRRGQLAVNANGLLALQSGALVQGMNGVVSLKQAPFTISGAGIVEQDGVAVAQLQLAKMRSTDRIDYYGSGLFSAPRSDVSLMQASDSANIAQGYLESSNVDTTDEMIAMVEVVRHFESSSKIIQSYDNMLDTTINVLADING